MNTIPFAVRGVVEGFYGAFYTAPERDDLIRFIGGLGYNHYFYGPKNDRQHRARWREAYPAKIMAQFERTAAVARDAGVTFVYALSPGVDICYSAPDDFEAVTRKFQAFYNLGVRAFSLWLDDIASEFQRAEDRARYGSYAEAHADLCNRAFAWLQAVDPATSLSMCPTDYWGAAPFSAYIHELGDKLHPAIDMFYTGPEICSPAMPVGDVAAFGRAARRRPIVWDNYPTNDLAMNPEMHIGPVVNRDRGLAAECRGIVVNPMLQAEASKIPLASYADFLADPVCYDPSQAWARAMWLVAGEESAGALRTFGENSLHSFLGTPEAEKLEGLLGRTLAELKDGTPASASPAAAALEAYFGELDEACYHLRFRMDNLALRNNLLPWIELLDLWLWMGRRALLTLRALEDGQDYTRPYKMMNDWLADISKHPKRICGSLLLALADYVHEQVRSHSVEHATGTVA